MRRAASETVAPWQHIAALGHGRYFTVEQAGSAVAITTPFDAEIATLAAQLDETRLYYGSGEERERMNAKVAATAELQRVGVDGRTGSARRVQRDGERRCEPRRRAGARARRHERPRRSRRSASGRAAGAARRSIARRAGAGDRGNRKAPRGATAGDRAARRRARCVHRGQARGASAAPRTRWTCKSTTRSATRPQRRG